MAVDGSARRERALAEIDGMFAGLTYIEKLGDSQEDFQYIRTFRKYCDLGGFLPVSFGTLKEGIIPNEITPEELGAQCVSEEEIPTDE